MSLTLPIFVNMPIVPRTDIKRMTQEEFGEVAYDVMNHIFAIHNEMGRFFKEKIYQRELAVRMPDIQLEAQIDVVYESFKKSYFADMLVCGGALFEFKAAEVIHNRHISQIIHYLRLFDLVHGKIINIRPEQVESQFVNCRQSNRDLRTPEIDTTMFNPENVRTKGFRDLLIALVQEWGTGLDLKTYEQGLVHFLGGDSKVCRETTVTGSRGELGSHQLNYISEAEVFWLTSFPEPDKNFAKHARRLRQHTSLKTIQWANIATKTLTFTTLK